MKNKIKSYGFWVSLSGAVVVLVEAIGRAVGFIANADIINNIIMSIAGVLVVFGIVTMPQDEAVDDLNLDETDDDDDTDNADGESGKKNGDEKRKGEEKPKK